MRSENLHSTLRTRHSTLAMPQIISCPSCGQQLKVPESQFGKRIRCPRNHCNHEFVVPVPSLCPGCTTPITADATICDSCGYQLAPGPTRVDEEKPNICPNTVCGALNPPGERLCQRCGKALPGAIGQVIAGKYRIEQYLAEGGFGVVYKATELATGRPAALKEMLAIEPKEFEVRKRFFRKEAETLRALQHVPIVPRLYDTIEDQATAYLALEFIPGDNLLNLLDRPGAMPFSIAMAANWGARIADALEQMHRQDPPIVHRDMKPENIMLLPDQQTIRLIDFGTARDVAQGPRGRGVAKTKVYTEGYAPPEQIMGRAEPRSDLFALAGTLYHLVTGKAPEGTFTGAEVRKNLDAYPPADRWFYELLAINLSEDLNDRYPTARQIMIDLDRRSISRDVTCTACRSMTPARQPYCQSCAAPLTPPGPGCPQCSAPSLIGSRFCTACGARL